MANKRNVDMSAHEDVIKIVQSDEMMADQNETNEGSTAEENAEAAPAAKKAKVGRARSAKYKATRAQVDKTKLYDSFAAVELIKKLSYSRFAGTVTADVVLREIGESVTLTFPHATGKTVRVGVVSDELLAEIEAGTISFDVLITEPQFMPKLAKFARILGPKGLMPNPKNGTITPNPEIKKKELESGKTTYRSEKKAALMHITLGKTDMETKALVENLNTLIAALGTKATKLSLTSTMSPSVKVALA